ncbi:MAG: discoidin domain-containing protein [Clostridia bacterium]|nr:discoidin domain-containing protein [Clostridia bacterium]
MKRIIAVVSAIVMLFTQVAVSAADIQYYKVVENPDLVIPPDPSTIPVAETVTTEAAGTDGQGTVSQNISTLIVEFEDITDIDGRIVKPIAYNGASGGKVMGIRAAAHNTGNDDALAGVADITLTVNFNDYGAYNMWLRYAKGTNVFYSYDNNVTRTTPYNGYTDPEDPNFEWVKLTYLTARNKTAFLAEPGSQLNIYFEHRYKDVNLDKMIFTTDLAFEPKGPNPIPNGDTSHVHPIPSIKPIEGHPRLYIAAKDLDQLRENAAQPEMAPFVENVKNNARWPIESKQDGTYNATVPVRLMGRSMAYLLGYVDDAHARETIEHCKTYLETAEYNLKAGDITRQVGSEMEAAAVVYDWLYPLLTEEEKEFFVAHLKKLCTWKEMHYPPVGNYIYGHDGEKEVFQDMLSVGIAIYDEDPEVWNVAAGAYEKMVPSRRMFNAAGNHPSGSSYGTWRFHCELMSEIMMDAMEIPMEKRIGEGAWNVPLRWLYARNPAGGMFAEGDSSYMKYFVYQYNRTPAMMAITANLYPDAPLNALVYGEWLMNESLQDWGNMPVYMLLIWDKDHPNKADLGQNMPLSYHSTYPLTQMYARTSWQKGLEAPVAVAYMQGRETLTDTHDHPDLGSFQLYYKGTLAADARGPQDGAGWLTEMDANWARRAIAHNIITVKDPEEVYFDNYYIDSRDWTVVSNDGGMDWRHLLDAIGMETYEDLLARPQLAVTEGIYSGPNELTPEFSYLQTNTTAAYSGRRVNAETGILMQDDLKFENVSGTIVTRDALFEALGFSDNPRRDFYPELNEKYPVVPKLTDNTRSMVFIDLFNDDYPAAFVVFDKVTSTNKAFEKNFVLHTLEEPIVEGDKVTVSRTTDGHNGKMVVKALFPENPDIEVIGGEGKGTWVDGKNYGDPADDFEEGAGWRFETSPSVAAENDIFLHAMYVTDHDRNLPELPMYKEVEGNFVGVTIMDRTVFFDRDANDVTGSFSLNIRDNNNGADMSVMVADVTPGVWMVTGPDKTQNIEVTEEACALYFKGKPGKYTITRNDKAMADKIEYPRTEKALIGDYQIYGSDGLFRSQKSPTKLIDGVPYLAAEDYLPAYGENIEIIDNGDGTWTIKNGQFKSVQLWPGTKKALFDKVRNAELPNPSLLIDGKLYVNPIDVQSTINCNITYDELAYLMKVVILDDIERLFEATNTQFDKIVSPAEAVASSDDGNVVEGMLDLNRETRWTGNGRNEWFTLDLGAEYDIDYILMSFYSGHKRATIFDIEVSKDGVNWLPAWSGQSSGTTDEFEQFYIQNSNGVRHLRFKCYGNTVNTYNSITETIIVKK